MPRRTRVTNADLAWLRKNHLKKNFQQMADHIGCCVDTLKRILVREGIQQVYGAKYQEARTKEELWTRPCMSCGDTKPRPKNWYFCLSCRKKRGYDE